MISKTKLFFQPEIRGFDLARRLVPYCVLHVQSNAVEFGYAQLHGEAVAESQRTQVAALHRQYGHQYALCLYLRKRHSCLTEVVYSRFFKYPYVVRVVHYSHFVRFVVVNAALVRSEHSIISVNN